MSRQYNLLWEGRGEVWGQIGFTPNLYHFYKDAWPFGFHLGSVPFIDKSNSIKPIKFRLLKPPGLENGQFPQLLQVPANLTSSVCPYLATSPLKYPERTAAEAGGNFEKELVGRGSPRKASDPLQGCPS